MKQLNDLDLNNKRVLIRADFNVPIDEQGAITDDNRITQSIPTIKTVLEKGGKAVLMSHLGDPSGKPSSTDSLAPVAKKLSELLGQDVALAPSCIGAEVESMVKKLERGSAVLLENLRFHPGEKANDATFGSQIASLGEAYVNDAFATAHRAHASVVAVPKHFTQKAPGLLMQRELDYYEKALLHPKRPLCVVLGGSKVSTKLNALINIANKTDKLIIGGAMANTFLAAQGIQMGRSLYETELFPKVLELLVTLARKECKVYLPVDFMVGPSPSAKGLARAVPALEVPPDTMALDIGPATSLLFREAIHSAETIVWNGPMGAFENEEYSKGTTDMIESIAGSHALTVVGGGDTDAAIHHMQLGHKFSYISTGGGAFLALLEGKSLPAIDALK
ncbi:MAG: phosphoglycerate kinase [Oligoflexia bacterium]|nr:phosphoglycerate kinase [Oligoflexia bacterium]